MEQTLAAVGTFIETAPDAMLVVDVDGRIRVANRRAADLFGASDLTGIVVEDLLPVHLAAGHAELRRRFTADPTPRVMGAGRELDARRLDGVEFPVDISLGMIEAPGGEHLVSVAVRDITDRRAAEASAAQYQFIVDASHEAIFALDIDGTVTTWNPAAERLTGCSAGDAIGRPLGESMVIADAQVRRRLAAVADQGHALTACRTAIVRDDGGRTPISISLVPTRDAKGTVVGSSGLCRDITEEVETQEILGEVQTRIAETQRLARIGLWAWDLRADELQWSEQLHDIAGVGPLEFGGDLSAHLASIAERYRDEVADAMRRAVEIGEPLAVEYEIERPDGSVRWVALSGDAVADDDGTVVALRGICQDLTERHAAIEALRQADNLKDEFLGVVSHELRTPLTSIIGFGQLLHDRVDDELRTFTEVVVRNGHEMHGMVERILDFSRVQGGKIHVQVQDRKLGELVDDLQPLVGDALAAHEFLVDVDRDLVLAVDDNAFRRILVNLLTNAAKFTEPGGTIVLRGERGAGRTCHLSVHDDGPGIPEDSLEEVFERFVQLGSAPVAARRGAGVGLAIVRSYVNALGGDVWAESPPGQGACFHVELPLAAS